MKRQAPVLGKRLRPDRWTIGVNIPLILVVFIVTTIVIVRVRSGYVHFIQHNTDYSGADVEEQLASMGNHLSRTLTTMDNQQHAINHGCNQNSIGKRCNGWGIYYDVREVR